MPKFHPPGQCPVCGEWVYRKQAACSSCGACGDSGWREEADYDGLDLPDSDFDYNEFVSREFGKGHLRRIGEGKYSSLWWWVAMAVLAALIAGLLLQIR